MNNIINKIKEEAIKEACKLDLEIIDVEWVNEFGTNILRIIADSKESLNIDQATALNEAMSLKLDELDLILSCSGMFCGLGTAISLIMTMPLLEIIISIICMCVAKAIK